MRSSYPDFSNAEEAAHSILAVTTLRPRLAVVLGSGLGGFADELEDAVRIPYGASPIFR